MTSFDLWRRAAVLALAFATLSPCGARAQSVPSFTGRTGAAAVQGDGIKLSEMKTGFASKADSTRLDSEIARALAAEALKLAVGIAPPTSGDAQPTLQAALNSVAAAGGGTVRLLPVQYSITGANLVIPSGVRLVCEAAGTGLANGLNYTAIPCGLYLNPARTVQLSSRSALEGVPIINASLPAAPTDMRSGITYVAAYSGTAITIAGDDAKIVRGFALGFNLCISNLNAARLAGDDFQGDCNSGVKNDNNHDIARLNRFHFWPFGTVGQSYFFVNFPVTGYASNGSGAVRLTMSNTAGLVTGDTISLSLAAGLPRAMRTRWPITVVDGTHVDLTGSVWIASATASGTLVAGSAVITVSDNSAMGVGMTVSGSGIPAGTTIVDIKEARVTMSAAATASGTGVALTIAPVSTSGARAWIDTAYRPGIGFEWTNGERNSCTDCFEYGHRIGVHLGTGAGWTALNHIGLDGQESENGQSYGILIDSNAYDSIITGPWISAKGIAFQNNSSSGPSHKVTGGSINAGSTLSAVQFQSGDTVFLGNTLAAEPDFGTPSAYVSQGIHSVVFAGNNLGAAPLLYQNGTAPTGFTAGNVVGVTP